MPKITPARTASNAARRERLFWAQVDKRGPDDCWPWTGACQGGGYGTFGTKGERLVHRVAYEYMAGPIPKGLVLDHVCHTRDPGCPGGATCPHRKCCNPEHLEPVTRRENIARGRGGDSWGYEGGPVPQRHVQLALPFCACGSPKPVYKSGKCRPCYKKWLKDPAVKRPSKRTREERFWEKVSKRGPVPQHKPELGRCWVWTAGINGGTGYGMFSIRHGQMMDAHRFSYLLAHGSIPEKHDVHHVCLVRRCVRPDHLEAMTRSQNLAERMNRRSAPDGNAKGREDCSAPGPSSLHGGYATSASGGSAPSRLISRSTSGASSSDSRMSDAAR